MSDRARGALTIAVEANLVDSALRQIGAVQTQRLSL
jgi:hypothetical protein